MQIMSLIKATEEANTPFQQAFSKDMGKFSVISKSLVKFG